MVIRVNQPGMEQSFITAKQVKPNNRKILEHGLSQIQASGLRGTEFMEGEIGWARSPG